ncbi:hypothetical protein TNCV_2439291 [Trichonephila clavipes]|nr:hypothetical protein TNCV_2439291 [Trichonephila clavipes]
MGHMFSIGERSGKASRPGRHFNLVIDEEPLDNACHVWSRIILLKYGCVQALNDQCGGAVQHPLSTMSPDSNLTTVVLQTDA